MAAVLFTAALALAACGGKSNNKTDTTGSESPSPSETTSSAPATNVKVGLAYDIGGRGDQSFNDAAAAGLDKAKSDLGVKVQELEASAGESDAAKEERLRLLATNGANTIVAVGFAYAGPLEKVAKEFPDVHFGIVDDASFEAANVANLVFAENEGSFLVGAAAALKSQTGHIGFVGGVNVPLIQKFQAGYEAGAKAVKSDIKIDAQYLTQPPDFTGFNDPVKGKAAAKGMFDAGADVVYHAAGGSGGGVFEAAKAANKMAIGVDSDQYNLPSLASVKDVIITSMIKRVDVAVFTFIKSAVDGSPLTGLQTFDLKNDGVGYATSGGKIDDITSKLDEFKSKIVNGEITVPDKM
jgi:basic membrane protein A